MAALGSLASGADDPRQLNLPLFQVGEAGVKISEPDVIFSLGKNLVKAARPTFFENREAFFGSKASSFKGCGTRS